MTSDVDYSMHEVDGPSEISRHVPLSDRQNRQNRRAPEKKKRRGNKTRAAGAKRAPAGEADRDTDIPDSSDSTPQDRDDHEIDYYA